MLNEREEDVHREHSEKVHKKKHHHKDVISKVKNWVVDWLKDTTQNFWSVDRDEEYQNWEDEKDFAFDDEESEMYPIEENWDDEWRWEECRQKKHEFKEKIMNKIHEMKDKIHEAKKNHHNKRNGHGRGHGHGRHLQAADFQEKIVGGPNRGIDSRMHGGRKLSEQHIVFYMQTSQVPKNK